MTESELEDFQWTYGIIDLSAPANPPIKVFIRISHAIEEMNRMKLAHPEMDFGVFIRGDVMYTYPQDGIHKQTH